MAVVVVRHDGDALGEADTTGLGLGSDSDEQSTFQMVVGFFDWPGLYPPKPGWVKETRELGSGRSSRCQTACLTGRLALLLTGNSCTT